MLHKSKLLSILVIVEIVFAESKYRFTPSLSGSQFAREPGVECEDSLSLISMGLETVLLELVVYFAGFEWICLIT